MTLYEITGDYMRLLQMAEDGDVDEQTFKDTMEGIEDGLKRKADGYANIIKALKADVDMLDNEIKRLKDRKDAIANKADALKDNLKQSMVITGETAFKTDLFSYRVQATAPALKLDEIDIKKVPLKYRITPPQTINKEAVKKALKDGANIKWARLESGEALYIR